MEQKRLLQKKTPPSPALRIGLAWGVLLVANGLGVAAPADSFEREAREFLATYCARCHNADKRSSGVRVDHLDASLDDGHLKLWSEIRNQVRDGVMPPEDAKAPTVAERERLVAWIDGALAFARSRPQPNHGVVRRLTAAQYRNTLRELLGLEEDLTTILPPDAVSRDGFVNNRETLQISPLLLETYFEIAEKALARTIVDPSERPTVQNFRVELGARINPEPLPEKLILGAGSTLLDNADFVVTQPQPVKPFAYEPFLMRTKYRFIEGYAGNATVRDWREYDSIYHAVFACVRGANGYPKGNAFDAVPGGLLLRPAIPSAEIFKVDSTYGPRANFKIAVRELPDHGRFRVRVNAARYEDGLLLEPGTPAISGGVPGAFTVENAGAQANLSQTVVIPEAAVYQVDVHPVRDAPSAPKSVPVKGAKQQARSLVLRLGGREFAAGLRTPAFLAVRLPAGNLDVAAVLRNGAGIERIVFTPLDGDHPVARQYAAFEKRVPKLGVYLGFRRDCGSTLFPVGAPREVTNSEPATFVFEGSIGNFPSPEVEKDNVNYLAGVREIGVRNEYTDGRDMPRLLIRSVEFEGPYYEAWPPPGHRAIFGEGDAHEDSPAAGREVIRNFATRAYRRPVTAQEEATLAAVFERSLAGGRPFRDAVKDALVVALTSPQFLFLSEDSRGPEAELLDADELASKLSYFLWNGPPDATTRRLAAAGALRAGLDAEVTRMVADPRFAEFAGEFVSQWLALEKFQVLEVDGKLFPRLTRDARAHLRREPVEFFEHLVRHNLPVRYLIESDFILANEVVAAYYGLGLQTEGGFEFAPLRHGRPDLGGVLTQAAVLAGLSDGRESNPVKRGAWLARKIVAEPPDDPPPNVPALKESSQNLTLRQRLEEHRNQPGCAQCHSKVDPWGLPFEEYDAGGLLKAVVPDTRSTLPDKTEVQGVAGLRSHLAGDRIDQVAYSVLKHLSTYACGRSLSYIEQEELRRDALRLKPGGYKMLDLIRFVVQSKAFLEK